MSGKCPDCGGELALMSDVHDRTCRDCGFTLSHREVLAAGVMVKGHINMADFARIADLLPRPVGHKDAALRRKFYVSPYTRGDE